VTTSSLTGQSTAIARAISSLLSRRKFLQAAGSGAVLTAMPLPLAAAAVAVTAQMDDWTIDDMWGVYPRYSEAIGFGKSKRAESTHLELVDAQLVS
jgi:hypothetical protein